MKVWKQQEKDEVLTLGVLGPVDSTNADEFYSEVCALRDASEAKVLEFDIDKLEYISSAGLRVLLKLRKQGTIRIINASLEIMDVLEDTGFTAMMEIKKRIPTISLEGCDLVGHGANGDVYRLGNERVVKVFHEGATLSVVEHERRLAQLSLIEGVPTAISYNVVKVGNCYGAVFELVDAKTLSVTMKEHPEDFESYADQYVAIYKGFHQTHVSPDEFPSIKDTYHGYIDGCADWYTADELALLHRIVDSIPDRDTLIHGDYHANNIMVTKDELLMIDMGDVGYGHPVFDFLATAATQANLVDLDPAYAEIHTRMPVDMIRRLWNYLLDHYFEGLPSERIAHIDEQVRLFSKLKVALAPVVGRGIPQELMEASVADAKVNFLARSDELIGAIDW